jgi:hypothetical protein
MLRLHWRLRALVCQPLSIITLQNIQVQFKFMMKKGLIICQKHMGTYVCQEYVQVLYEYKLPPTLGCTQPPPNINNATIHWGTVTCGVHTPPSLVCQRPTRPSADIRPPTCTKTGSDSRPLGPATIPLPKWVQ